MNKKILLTLLILLTVVLSASAISASDVNVTDSYATNLVDDTSDVSVPLENTADSSEISVSSDSNVDNDSSKVSLSSEEVLGSENSNALSTNSNNDDNNLSGSDGGITNLSASSNALVNSNVSSKIDASKTVTAKDITKYYKGSTQYSAKFLDAYGKVLANAKVKITVNGVTYTKTTNANGVASLAINLNPGTYKVVATNPDTGFSLTTTFKILSTISASDISKVYTDGRKFYATFYKSNGKVLANKYVQFKINGQTYNVKTNSKGVAGLSLTSLKKGTYKIISYNKDGLTKTNKVKVVSYTTSSLTTKMYTFLKSDSKKIKVKLLNGLGYAPGSGKIIYFKINGKTYSAATNSYGVAKLKLPSLKEGAYTVRYYFAGNNFYKKSVAYNKVFIINTKTPTFTVKSVTTFGHGAGFPFKVALTAGKVPLAKRTVYLTVNGNTYTKTTDKNGIVSLPINLAIGKYTITYKNKAESKVNSKTGSTAITVKERLPTTLTWKSGTSFYQGSQTYKVLLKNSNNQALAGQTVKLTVNSKTYTAKTASNGYATFTVNVGVGNHTVSYKFEATGVNGYAPSSGSTKIEVAKKDLSLNGYGYWVFGGDMKKVNLNSLASYGTTDLFLNYYAFTAHSKSDVESWIASANKLGMRVHIWMQTFYDGGWINPVKNGAPNQALFNEIINEAKTYAAVKGVSGIHFDYLRYPGNAYQTSGGTEAINTFVQQAVKAIRGVNSNIIISCALMPEKTDNKYYYGQDMATISKYVDVVVPMIYKGNYHTGSAWIKSTTKWFVDNSNGAKVWSGLQGYVSDDNTAKLPYDEIKYDSQMSVNGGASGVMIFRWSLTNFVNFKSLTGYMTASATSAASTATATGTSSSSAISIANIVSGATTLKNYYAANNKFPTSVSAGGKTFTIPEFLYLMSQAIYQIGNSNTNDIAIISGVSAASSPFGDSINDNLQKADFITVAGNIANFIKNNKQAPNYASSTLGRIIYEELVDAESRILAYYGNNAKTLPNYVVISTSSGTTSSGSSSGSFTASQINDKNTISDLTAYLKSTKNCDISDSRIKSLASTLTKGLTTAKQKATAIFNYVRDSISYSFYYNTNYGAAGTYSAKKGNCVDQAHLLVALYRASGLAARYVHGTCKFSSGNTYGHVWTQVLIDGVWVCGDPTSNRNSLGSVANWNTNSYTLHGKYASLSF